MKNKKENVLPQIETLVILIMYISVMSLWTLILSDAVLKILFAILAGLKLYDITDKLFKYLTKEFDSKEE